MLWKIMHYIYPPILRALERLRFHAIRQDFLLGTLNPKHKEEELKRFLMNKGFAITVFAWKDPGEVFGLRMIDKDVFQWHIRLFKDGEIRGHYEYSSEGNPINHVLENGFKEDKEYFKLLLGDYLITR